MPLTYDISLRDGAWSNLDLPLENICDAAVQAVSGILSDGISGEVSLAFVGDTHIQTLNRNYRGQDKPTNVLSFPMDSALLGDIVLARETIVKEAAQQDKAISDHLSHLIVHGFLHLLGYDHADDKDAIIMEKLEIEALSQMGVDNPYEIKERKC